MATSSPSRIRALVAQMFNRPTESAQTRATQLAQEKSHLEAVVASMREGVLVTDKEGLTRHLNPAFCEMFGITGQVEGISPLELTRQSKLEELIGTSLATGNEQAVEIDISDPSARRLALATSILSDASGVVTVARDITELTRLSRTRRDFVANVSHELKTPLSAIRGYAETLQDSAREDPQVSARFLERILQQCVRLEVLLEDLLTLSRLESLEGEVVRRPLELDEVLNECVELMTPRMREKGIELTTDIQRDSPFSGDREALERLVANLLDNAIKYNRESGKIALRLIRSNATAVIEVEDTGIGIPPSSLTRVFERFYRVDKGRSRSEGGTGLGLAIVKHVAQLHGGRVQVESRLGQGSLFRVHLPFQKS